MQFLRTRQTLAPAELQTCRSNCKAVRSGLIVGRHRLERSEVSPSKSADFVWRLLPNQPSFAIAPIAWADCLGRLLGRLLDRQMRGEFAKCGEVKLASGTRRELQESCKKVRWNWQRPAIITEHRHHLQCLNRHSPQDANHFHRTSLFNSFFFIVFSAIISYLYSAYQGDIWAAADKCPPCDGISSSGLVTDTIVGFASSVFVFRAHTLL